MAGIPLRTADQYDATQDQEDEDGGDDVPAAPGDIL
jgi:hypothetical protein